MSRYLSWQARSSPLRLFSILEWVLLGIVAIAQISIAIYNPIPHYVVLNIVGIIAFTLMGLIVPQQKIAQLVYTGIEFGILFLLTFISDLPLLPFLYLVVVIRNCSLFDKSDRVIVTTLSFFGGLLSQGYRLWHQQMPIKIINTPKQVGFVWLGFIVIFGLNILFLQLLVNAVLAERERQQELTIANDRLRQYALQVEELATVQERNRIARDIHDSLGHSLTGFNIHLEAALRLLASEPTEAAALLLEVKQLGSKALQDVRRSVTTLRANPLEGQSLQIAIAGLVNDFQRSTGILPTCHLEIHQTGSNQLDTTLYRLIQESLTNTCKYASASKVSINLRQTATAIQITIEDNGKGFDLSHNRTGFGLQGMHERTVMLGGTLTIDTAIDRGCRITAIFPLG